MHSCLQIETPYVWFFLFTESARRKKPVLTAEDADLKYYTGADGTVTLKCDACDASLGSMKEWATHQSSVHQVKAGDWLEQRLGFGRLAPRHLPCPVCWKSFQVSNLAGHMAVKHKKDFPFVCSQCGKGYSAAHSLRSHNLREHEGVIQESFLCLLCGATFLSKGIS
jgi:hypothetical protein